MVRINGQQFDPETAVVKALDHGFLYGNGLFETFRAVNGRPFALAEHLERLHRSSKAIGVPVPNLGELASEVMAAVQSAGEPDAYVRLTVSRGPGAPAPDPSSCGRPTVMVVVRPFTSPPERWLSEGLRTITAHIRRNTSSPLTRIKSLNYLECILAKQAAKSAGADDAIFLDSEGNVAEATAWNVFWVERDRLVTPDESGPILPGITRAIVLNLARKLAIDCLTGLYSPTCLASASEAFVTNSLYGIVPIGSFDGLRVGSGVPGPITRRLREAYQALEARSPNWPHRLRP